MYVTGILVLQLVKVELYLITFLQLQFCHSRLGVKPSTIAMITGRGKKENKKNSSNKFWFEFFFFSLCVAFNVKYLILSFFLIFLFRTILIWKVS